MTDQFTPLDYAEQLEAAGMSHAHAHIIAKALEASRNGTVSKADLAAAVETLQARISGLESKFLVFKAEVEAELKKLDAKFEAKFAAINSRLDKIEAELVVMRWGFGLMFTLQFGILAKLFFP